MKASILNDVAAVLAHLLTLAPWCLNVLPESPPSFSLPLPRVLSLTALWLRTLLKTCWIGDIWQLNVIHAFLSVQVFQGDPVVMKLHLGKHCCGSCRCPNRHSVHSSSSYGKARQTVVQLAQAGMCVLHSPPHHFLIQPL